MPSLKSMRCVLWAPSRAAVLILRERDVKGETAIDWLAFKWTPSACCSQNPAGGKERERLAHAAVQDICFDYLVRNGNTETPFGPQVTEKLLLTCFCPTLLSERM